MKFSKTAALASAAAFLLSGAAHAVTGNARGGLTLIKQLNTIVLQDLTAGGGEIEGKLYVGGNLGGNGFNLGFGNSTYGMTQSFRSTLAVGGNVTSQMQLQNGPNGSGGPIGSFGAYVVGNVTQKLNLNSNTATIRVGGNLKDMNYTNGTTLDVRGSVIDTLALGDNSVTRIGGNASGFNSGNNNVQLNVTGTVGNLGIGTGTVRIGGSLSNLSGGNNLNLNVVGAIGNGNLGSNAFVKAIGNVNVNGTGGATIYTAGDFTGNANGAVVNEFFTYNGTITAPTAPVAPTEPAVNGLAPMTAQIKADVEALSTALSILPVTNTISTAMGNPNQITFTVADSNPATAAVFNLTSVQFSNAQQFQFNFASLNKPVIINISGAADGVYNWNANGASASPGVSVLQDISQNVIYNFLDATTLNINREVYGSVLAARATVTNAANINGSVVAKIFNQQAEVHLGTYARSITIVPDEVGVVPEPATWALLIAGFGMTGVAMRRRKAVVTA